MRSLLQFTLDLFDPEPKTPGFEGSNRPLAPVDSARIAINSIADTDSSSAETSPPRLLSDAIAPAVFRHPRANRESRLCDALVAYEFKRGKRRTIGFVVGPDGLVVSAPKWVPLYEVEAALREKAAWVVKKLGETR